MELPRRERGDELLLPGEVTAIRARLRQIAPAHDLVTVIACAFDHRTRMLPFIGADLKMAPAGVRAIGAAMADSGFPKTRIVLQQWNRRFRPAEMKLDGRVPDLFLVSSMTLHAKRCHELVADAARIDPAHRPLVVVGGPDSVYQPWNAFRAHEDAPPGADVVITGEEYIWLSLLEVLLTERAAGEPIRQTFLRVRDRGLLDDIPGLVYAHTDRHGVAEELVDTGVQRLLGDLDELPNPALGYDLLEPPSRSRTLAAHALPTHRVRKYTPISSLVLTFGCKFRCPYCPIPAYNQRQHRCKSPERIVEEITGLQRRFGFHFYFGTDDNFFNNHERTLAITEALRMATIDGTPVRRKIRWATEATVHDTLQLRDHMREIRGSGLTAVWMGVEDLTATFVKKGQSVDKTTEAFQVIRSAHMVPMPMMMHHDGQPLYTPGKPYGLLNQAQILRNAGAVMFQVLMMTPAMGSTLYEEAYTNGLAFKSANGREVEPRMLDGNRVVASGEEKPWRKQLNLLLAYIFFYNPLRFLKAMFFPKSRLYLADIGSQVLGMRGLLQTIRRTVPWIWHLWRGPIVRTKEPPVSRIPIRGPGGERADHALNAQAEEPRSSPTITT